MPSFDNNNIDSESTAGAGSAAVNPAEYLSVIEEATETSSVSSNGGVRQLSKRGKLRNKLPTAAGQQETGAGVKLTPTKKNEYIASGNL